MKLRSFLTVIAFTLLWAYLYVEGEERFGPIFQVIWISIFGAFIFFVVWKWLSIKKIEKT